MAQGTFTEQLELFPEWNKRQDFIDSWHWKSNEEASLVLKEDVIKPAFKALRLKDYICRMNFSCCGGCASSELYQMAKERGKEGIVFWHRQDEETMVRDRTLYLGYGSMNDSAVSSRDVGNHIVEAFQLYIDQSNLPIQVDWDGNLFNKIKISW